MSELDADHVIDVYDDDILSYISEFLCYVRR